MDFTGMLADNPVSEMFEMLGVARDFEKAVEHNLVIDFEEYVYRFGVDWNGHSREDEGALPCSPFVYVGEKYADDRMPADRIVADACTIDHADIISVYGEHSMFGYPRLSVSDEDCPDGTVWMSLEYVSAFASEYEAPVDMTPQVYVNRLTGEVTWCD